MDPPSFVGLNYQMQPRINLRRRAEELLSRSDEDCSSSGASNTCEKPVNNNTLTLPIVVGIVVPIVVAAIVLTFLHRRNVRRQRAEDAKDPHKSLDFGLGDGPANKRGKRRTLMLGGEKGHRHNQVSMDMNLDSPYLLPPGVASQSHESISTITRGFPSDQDPYRLVPQYATSDAGSIRSFGQNKETSIYSGSGSNTNSMMTARPSVATSRLPPRQASLQSTPVYPDEKVDPFATPTEPEPAYQLPGANDKEELALGPQAVVPEIGHAGYPDDHLASNAIEMPDVQSPPPAMPPKSRDRELNKIASPPQELSPFGQQETDVHAIGVAHDGYDEPHANSGQIQDDRGLGLNVDFQQPRSPPNIPDIAEPEPQRDLGHQNQPQIQTTEYYEEYEDYDVSHHDNQHHQDGGLGVPQQDAKRLSIGFRPLPPDDIMESEDPEYRANRIRSFYKEYFEDTKEPAPPMPGQYDAHGGIEYYEDYDQGYLGDAAYYDADTNAFVMPYAQPVTRRAMTPPPGSSGPRSRRPPGPGRRGPPRGPAGSLGGMSMPGGPRFPRSGSAFGGSRAGSAFGPRPDSSASNRFGARQPKKQGPPPSALNTLPTPSKLKDDTFAIMGAMDFAPPESFGDRARGRSQSPLGERRPYMPKVPVASPLVTSFDDLAVMPSPHLLRKSGTFTNLDFAPPKKFKEADTMSDAGSIRSNRSGLSAAQHYAIREGAGRISRLPEDMVFTTASQSNQLKPQWGMRP